MLIIITFACTALDQVNMLQITFIKKKDCNLTVQLPSQKYPCPKTIIY